MNHKVYYYISDLDLIGKEEDFIPYIYRSGVGWVIDKEHLLTDRLMGYEDEEPDGSTYKIGNMNKMDLIKEISMEEAEIRISKI